MNEPGSSLSSPTRLILIDSTSRAEAAHNLGVDNLPPCSITMGVATIMAAAKSICWMGDDKADIIKESGGRQSERHSARFLSANA